MIGAGSFGTAVAVVLVRAGMRTTLLCRTQEQARELEDARENKRYLEGVELPDRLKVRVLGGVDELKGTMVEVQVTPSNCIQCGAITAKGGRLTPPEGGDGPNYQMT